MKSGISSAGTPVVIGVESAREAAEAYQSVDEQASDAANWNRLRDDADGKHRVLSVVEYESITTVDDALADLAAGRCYELAC